LRLRGPAGLRRLCRSREPVVWIRPFGGLPRVYSRSADPVGQQREQVPATLTHGCERYVIPGQVQCDLERAARPVPAGGGRDRKHGAIDAA
jgi:hypothetical protein